MRYFAMSILFVLLLVALQGCQSGSMNSPGGSPVASDQSSAAGAFADLPVAVMWINGMACPQCSYNVDLQLKKVPGVEHVTVDMSSGKVQAFLSRDLPPTRTELTAAIENTTFTLVRLDMPADVNGEVR